MPAYHLWNGTELNLWRVSFHSDDGQCWTDAWIASPGRSLDDVTRTVAARLSEPVALTGAEYKGKVVLDPEFTLASREGA